MPSERCGACRKFISSTDGIRCTKCNVPQHRNCVALPAKGNLTGVWRCSDCKKGDIKDHKDDPNWGSQSLSSEEHSQSDSSPTLTVQKSVTSLDVTNKDIIEEVRAMRLDLLNFRQEISELQIEVRSCVTRIDGLEAKLEALEKRSTAKNEECGDINSVINQLRADLNDRDQDLLANDLEIRGIPEEKGENPTHLIVTIAAKLGISLQSHDIVSAERIGGRFLNVTNSQGAMEPRSRALVVRMTRRDIRDELLQSARVRRTINTSDIGLIGRVQRFYINERLTKNNRQLFRLARDTGRQNNWQFIWTKRGRILARRKPGDPVVRIHGEKDIIDIIGPITRMDTIQ